MDEQYQLKIEQMKIEFDKTLNKKLDEERKNILETIFKIVPEIDKKKIIDAIDNKVKKEHKSKIDNFIDILEFIGTKDNNNIFKNSNGYLYNQKAELVGFASEDSIVFYSNCESLDKELELDNNKIKKIGFLT